MKKITALITFQLLLLAGTVFAAPITSQSVDQLMELSGINRQFANIPAGIMVGVQQAKQEGGDISDDDYAKIEGAVSKGFQPTAMLQSVSKSLKKGLNQAEAQELLAWYNSELGRKITQEEIKASDPAAFQEMVDTAGELMANSERVALAQKIDQLVNGSENAIEMQKNTARALYSAMVKLADPKAKVDYKPLDDSLAQSEPEIRTQLTQLITLSFLYSYKSLSNEEIGKYIGFLEKPTTRKFNGKILDAIKVAFNASATLMGETLAASLRNKQ